MGHERGRAQARRRHRHEPADRRDPGDGQPADLRQQPVRPRDQQRRLPGAARRTRTSRSSTTRSQAHYPPGSTYKLVAGTGGLADGRSAPTTELETKGYLTLGDAPSSTTGTGAASGPATSTAGSATRATRSSSRSPACSASTGSAYWAKQYGFGEPDRHRPAGRGLRASCPTNQWKQDALGAADLPRRDLPGRHRPGLRRRDADPADQRLCGARQRRHALPAAGRARHPRPGRRRSSGRSSRRSSTSWTSRPASSRRCARRPASVGRPSATPTTWSTCRSWSPASPARPSSGPATRRAACRSTPGSSASCPRIPSNGSLRRADRLGARRARLRLRLADQGQRRDRDRQVLPPAALRDREGLPLPTSSSAATSTRATDGRASEREPARVTDWAAKSVGAAWRAFDLQLVDLRRAARRASASSMAYTNSVEDGAVPLEAGTTFTPRPDVGGDRGRRLPRRDRLRLPLAQDASPGRSTALQLGLLVLTLADRRRRRRSRPLGRRSGRCSSSSASSPRS